MIREPDFSYGRFFVSPILGCSAKCKFCYIYSEGYKAKAQINAFSIEETIDYLLNHRHFVPGRNGNIISIGAWGDIFPKGDQTSINISLVYLKELCKLGNPIQLMSRFEIDDEVVDVISKCNQYTGHILYSTSISSFSNFDMYESNVSSPIDRLKVIQKLNENDVKTNVMIKPFIHGVTDKDLELFLENFKKYEVKVCVVGKLVVDDLIVSRMKRVDNTSLEDTLEPLDCTSGSILHTSSR